MSHFDIIAGIVKLLILVIGCPTLHCTCSVSTCLLQFRLSFLLLLTLLPHPRSYLKKAHNCRFGSVFRTEKSPTYFSRRLATFSNLYMSSVDHLMNYPLHHTFIPRRASLPHELDLNFDAVDPGLQ